MEPPSELDIVRRAYPMPIQTVAVVADARIEAAFAAMCRRIFSAPDELAEG